MAGLYARENLKIDHIISSPYSRASDTAKIITDQIDYAESNIIISSLFVERHLGILEGQPSLKNVNDTELDSIAAVETSQTLEDRVKQAYHYVTSLPYEDILIVSHGATGRMLCHVLDPTVPFWSADPSIYEANELANAQIVRLVL